MSVTILTQTTAQAQVVGARAAVPLSLGRTAVTFDSTSLGHAASAAAANGKVPQPHLSQGAQVWEQEYVRACVCVFCPRALLSHYSLRSIIVINSTLNFTVSSTPPVL
jgi:hypothetical protein